MNCDVSLALANQKINCNGQSTGNTIILPLLNSWKGCLGDAVMPGS